MAPETALRGILEAPATEVVADLWHARTRYPLETAAHPCIACCSGIDRSSPSLPLVGSRYKRRYTSTAIRCCGR
eukprot:4079130-Prymnesium_polylepis.1